MPLPFKVITGSSIVPQQPFSHLYQHVLQRDPKLHETLVRLAQPASLIIYLILYRELNLSFFHLLLETKLTGQMYFLMIQLMNLNIFH